MRDVENKMLEYARRVEQAQLFQMFTLGEMCVNHARSVPASQGFNDQTGNLRSSMGYIVFNHGVIAKQNFKQVLKGNEGQLEGKKLALEIGQQYRDKIVLVVVAGMNYAVAVESRGKDVLTSAELLAKQQFPILMNKLKNRLK